jgi:hypothetical protein
MTKVKKKLPISKRESVLKRNLLLVPIFIFAIKLIVMANASTPVWKSWPGGWAGADGEHYLIGMLAILVDGVFSNELKLQFWPAGYPLLLAIFGKISLTHILYFISIAQSVFYAYASYYFVETIRKSKIKEIAFTLAILLGVNPTLSLSSLVVGYESLAASCTLLIVAKLVNRIDLDSRKSNFRAASFLGGFFALISFIQPRYLVLGLTLIPLWIALQRNKKKIAALVGICALLIMTVAPTILLVRNHFANNKWVISTNLGSTMRIGAGPTATGGYIENNKSVPCISKSGRIEPSDSEIQKCVLDWYVSNPSKAIKLAFNKSIYFWSPWSGPLANGTMARNPWLKVNPIRNIEMNQEGFTLVHGTLGKIVSWMWLISGLVLLFAGFYWLKKIGGEMKTLAWFSLIPIILSWLVSIATIGDHRFRIPIMGLSLFLQVGGVFAIRNRFKTSKFESAFEQKGSAR